MLISLISANASYPYTWLYFFNYRFIFGRSSLSVQRRQPNVWPDLYDTVWERDWRTK